MGPFQAWVAAVHAAGGIAVIWPFKTGIYASSYGAPAARYAPAQYTAAFNANAFDVTAPQQPTPDNQWFYVLAPSDAIADAPQSMTLWQKFENAAFTGGDNLAEKMGLPSLAGLEHFIVGAAILTVAGVGFFLWMELSGKRGGDPHSWGG